LCLYFFSNAPATIVIYSLSLHDALPIYVFMELFDQDQALIEKKLLFCYKGVFQTNIKLKDNMPSGKYYLRFYTNYMNNFSEDLSDRKSTRLNSSHVKISYAVFCLKKKK